MLVQLEVHFEDPELEIKVLIFRNQEVWYPLMGYKDLDKKQTVADLISGHSLALQFNPERNILIEKNGKSI